jgi:hypothetical protein
MGEFAAKAPVGTGRTMQINYATHKVSGPSSSTDLDFRFKVPVNIRIVSALPPPVNHPCPEVAISAANAYHRHL